jgi:hypothetical protein
VCCAVFVLNKRDKATQASQGPDYHFNIYVHRRVSIGYRVAPSLVTRGILARPLPMTASLVLTPGPAPASASAGGAPFLSLLSPASFFCSALDIYPPPLFLFFFFWRTIPESPKTRPDQKWRWILHSRQTNNLSVLTVSPPQGSRVPSASLEST